MYIQPALPQDAERLVYKSLIPVVVWTLPYMIALWLVHTSSWREGNSSSAAIISWCPFNHIYVMIRPNNTFSPVRVHFISPDSSIVPTRHDVNTLYTACIIMHL